MSKTRIQAVIKQETSSVKMEQTTGMTRIKEEVDDLSINYLSEINSRSKTIKKKKPTVKKVPAIKKEPAIKKTRVPTPKKTRVPKKSKIKVESFATEEEAMLLPAMRGRIERARREKLFVISRNPKDSTKEEFQVTGSTGNLYTVKIGPILSCSCADFRYRRRHCKHMLMILLKMFSLPATSPIFQTMTPSHDVLRQIFSTCAPDPSTLIPEELKIMIDKKLNGEPSPSEIKTERRSLDSSDCPVCCDEFKEEAILDILFCRVCGNNIHKTCFNMWKSTRQHDVTCVYCRSPWEDPAASKKKGKNIKLNHEGFVNFGVELGLSDVRDTSTYRAFPY